MGSGNATSLGHLLVNRNETNVTLGSTNTTSTDDGEEVWTFNTIVSMLTVVTGFLFNGLVLVIFCKKPELRTPFNIYIINLLIANLCTIVIQYPYDIASSFSFPGWIYGKGSCSLYIYAIWTLEAVQFNSHQLIALNRLWAVLHPMSYRTRHSVRVAIVLCCAMWIYVHLTSLPLVLMDAFVYRKNIIENGCFFNAMAQWQYDLALNIILFVWPEVVMWLVLPIVFAAKIYRRRTVLPVKGVSASVEGISAQGARHTGGASTSTVRSRKSQRSATASSHTTAVLALLTVAVTVCWTPLSVFFIMKIFIANFSANHPTFLFTILAMFSIESTIDPIIFVFAMRPLKEAVWSVLQGWFRWLGMTTFSRKA